MKNVKNLFVAFIAVALMACTFSATAAEASAADKGSNVSAKASKSLKDMTLEELLAFLRTLSPEEVAALMSEVLATNDGAMIDAFGKAFTMLVASADIDTREQLLSSVYAANPGIAISDAGAVIPSGNLTDAAVAGLPAGGMEAFTAGNNTSAGNISLVDADVEVPAPTEYSAGATR